MPTFYSRTRSKFVCRRAKGTAASTTSATSIVSGEATFRWTGNRLCGTFVDGPAFVVVPAGETLELLDALPATAVVAENVYYNSTLYGAGSRLKNGSMMNPTRGGAYTLDTASTRATAGYQTFPATVSAGDCLLKGVSIAGPFNLGSGAARGGVCSHNLLFIVKEVPSAEAFAPPAVWPVADRVNRPIYEVDIDGWVARLPSYSSAGLGLVSWATVAQYFNKVNLGAALSGASNDPGGYEFVTPYQATYLTSNYGLYQANILNHACAAMLSDAWSTADKRACLIRMISQGIQTGEAQLAQYVIPNTDGGHFQFDFASKALAWAATRKPSRFRDSWRPTNLPREDRSGGDINQIGLAIRLGAAEVARCAPHSNGSDPYWWRTRNITAVGSATPGVTTTVTIASVSNEPGQIGYSGGVLTRVSDSVTAAIVSASSRTLTIVQPGVPFDVGQSVYVESPYSLAGQTGKADFIMESGAFRSFHPLRNAPYRSLQAWAGQVMFIRALGLSTSYSLNAEDYTVRCNTANDPNSTWDYLPHFDTFSGSSGEENFWTTHWATISATPSIFGDY